MLKLFRKKAVAKIVLWGILILILPAFVIWGSGSLGRKDKGPTYVGTIAGKKVSFDDFAQSIGAARCQIILSYFNQPKVLDTLLNNKQFMGRLAWDRLIMLNQAKKAGVKIPSSATTAPAIPPGSGIAAPRNAANVNSGPGTTCAMA